MDERTTETRQVPLVQLCVTPDGTLYGLDGKGRVWYSLADGMAGVEGGWELLGNPRESNRPIRKRRF